MVLQLLRRPVVTLLLLAERVSQNYQREHFTDFVPPRPDAPKVTTPDLEVFTPRFEPTLGRVVAVFVESGAMHVVFRDEVFPLSAELDEEYREERRQVFGRTADIESLEVDLDRGRASLLGTSSLPNLIYETNLHGYDFQPWTGRLYKNTWNGMMSTVVHPSILVRGGYEENPFVLHNGNRAAAENFALDL